MPDPLLAGAAADGVLGRGDEHLQCVVRLDLGPGPTDVVGQPAQVRSRRALQPRDRERVLVAPGELGKPAVRRLGEQRVSGPVDDRAPSVPGQCLGEQAGREQPREPRR